jgi:1-aminocyclopropane-1-carboxylate deaminase
MNIQDDGPFLYRDGIRLWIRRLDLIDPVVGGNKIFKLHENLLTARLNGYKHILTFGGAFSNHIAAVARFGKTEGFKTTGIIRGEQIKNVTLERAADDGMELYFISRTDYRLKVNFSALLPNDIKEYYIIPEGGANLEGVLGCWNIIQENDNRFDVVALACGTGATAAGIAYGMSAAQQLIGISVLNDKGFLESNINNWFSELKISPLPLIKIFQHFHFGGYGKSNEILKNFIDDFNSMHNLITEPVYTGKLFFGIHSLIKEGYFKKGSQILAIHTGGLQYLKY